MTLEPDAWTGMLRECRRRTLEAVGDADGEEIDWIPPFARITVGSLMYHVAAIEADWLYSEIRQEAIPGDVVAMFPRDVRDADGNLVIVTGETMEEHQSRMGRVRDLLSETLEGMTSEEMHRARSLPEYDVTPGWVIQHLLQHESQHRGQILTLRRSYRESMG